MQSFHYVIGSQSIFTTLSLHNERGAIVHPASGTWRLPEIAARPLWHYRRYRRPYRLYLDAAAAQANNIDTHQVSIVTRLFEEPGLSLEHARATERLSPKLTIDRIATANRRYLEKEALADDLASFTEAFCVHLARLPRLPDVIHAHFSDAAAVAAEARRRFAIPFVYTPHALGIDKRRHHGPSPALDGRIAAERTAIATADALIVSTTDEAERQVQAYGVPAGGHVHRIAPGRAES